MKPLLNIISKISLALFLIAAPFLFIGFGREFLEIIKTVSLKNSRWTHFLLGALIFLPVHFLAKRFLNRIWSYLETLEHELTHLLIGLLFLKIPVGFRVSAHEGGEVRQIGFGTTGQIWVSLAPYFFPTVSLAVLIISYFANLNNATMLGILGFSTAFHLVSNWAQTSFRQTDLQKAGIIKTVLILPVMNLIFYGAVLAFAAKDKSGFTEFCMEGFGKSFQAAVETLSFIF